MRGDFRGKRRTKSVDGLTTCSSKFTANITGNCSGSQDYTTFPANSQQWFGFASLRHPLEMNNNDSGSQDYNYNVPHKLTATVRARKTTTFPTNSQQSSGSQDYNVPGKLQARKTPCNIHYKRNSNGSGSKDYNVLYKLRAMGRARKTTTSAN